MIENFSVGHHYYTTSRKQMGIGSFAFSSVISKEECKELEQNATYTSPLKLPKNPTQVEIEILFPICYMYYRLKSSGKLVLSHSKYTGRTNHTPDRFGNFITHSILFDTVILHKRIPVLIKNLQFRQSLTIEEEDSFLIDTGNVQLDVCFKIVNEILLQHAIFLLEKPQYLNTFCLVVDTLIDGWLNKLGNNITICGSSSEVQNLLFSLYLFLPKSLINQITFSTYVDNPSKYSFQLCGIIPECGIKSLDEKYFKLFNIDNYYNYEVQNEFTKYISSVIAKQYNLNESIEILETILTEFNINTFSSKLNIPINTLKFRDNIAQETIDSFINLLKNEISMVQREKLIEYVSVRNVILYFEYIVYKFKEELRFKYNFREKYSLFENYHKQYFSKNLDFFESHFYQFCLAFKSFLNDIDKFNFSYTLITSFDSSRFLNKDELQEEIINVDYYFNESQNEEEFEKFFLRYGNLISGSHQNLLYMKNKRDLFDQVRENIFFDNIAVNDDKIHRLSIKDKNKLFKCAILSKNLISVFDLSFESYIPLIENYFSENSNLFWSYFFKQEEYFDNDSHSLSYIKRHFIISVLPYASYSECIKSLSLNYYEKHWLLEFYKENGDLLSYNKLSPLISYNIKEPAKTYFWGLWKK